MIQVIKYPCCGKIFAACTEPECYTDNDWLKSLKKYVKQGYQVGMIEGGKGKLRFEICDCKKDVNLFKEKE